MITHFQITNFIMTAEVILFTLLASWPRLWDSLGWIFAAGIVFLTAISLSIPGKYSAPQNKPSSPVKPLIFILGCVIVINFFMIFSQSASSLFLKLSFPGFLYALAAAIISFYFFCPAVEKTVGYYNQIKNKNRIVLFMLGLTLAGLALFIFYTFRTNVYFGEDWDYHLNSVSGYILKKEPMLRMIPNALYGLLLPLWKNPAQPWVLASLILGLLDIFLIYRIFKLLLPGKPLRSAFAALLASLTYAPLQLFLGYPGRKIFELAILLVFIYTGLRLIRRGNGFFWFGLVFGAGYCFHNGTFIILSPAVIITLLILFIRSRNFKLAVSGTLMFFAGAILPYLAVYSYLKDPFWFTRIFNPRDPLMLSESAYALKPAEIFAYEHMRNYWDVVNSWCPAILALLIALKWKGQRLLDRRDLPGIFLTLLLVFYLFATFTKKLSQPWFNFDNLICLAILINLSGLYFWLRNRPDEGEFKKVYRVLISYILFQSVLLCSWTITNWNQLNYVSKNDLQLKLPESYRLVDRLDTGILESEKRHSYRYALARESWDEFYPAYDGGDGLRIYPAALKKNLIRRMVLVYPNGNFMIDEGRRVSGHEEFSLNAAAGKKLILACRFSSNVKQPAVNIFIDGKSAGLFDFQESDSAAEKYTASPERDNKVDIINQQDPAGYSEWQYWLDSAFVIPAELITKDKVLVRIEPQEGSLQSFYYFAYSEE